MTSSEDDESDDDVPSAASDVRPDATHPVQDVPDGAGCTEIWERLSEHRERDSE